MKSSDVRVKSVRLTFQWLGSVLSGDADKCDGRSAFGYHGRVMQSGVTVR